MTQRICKCGTKFVVGAGNRRYVCLPCNRIMHKAWLARRKVEGRPIISTRMPREWHRAYAKEYYERPGVRARIAALEREYCANPANRPRYVARWKLRRAIVAGKITRQPCEVCGVDKVDGHHDDYSKPLKVRWLCRQHHAAHHLKSKATRGRGIDENPTITPRR